MGLNLRGRELAALYEAVGGEPGLEKILVNFYERMSRDVLIGYFFDGRDLRAIALKQKEFLMRAWGVSQEYGGRSPTEAHSALPPILKGHFDRRLVLLAETLREAGLEERHAKVWVAFEERFRDAVVTRG
jgi:hemoglobin